MSCGGYINNIFPPLENCQTVHLYDVYCDYYRNKANLKSQQAKISELEKQLDYSERTLSSYAKHHKGCRLNDPRYDPECNCGLEGFLEDIKERRLNDRR